jgi:hypothetical protein
VADLERWGVAVHLVERAGGACELREVGGTASEEPLQRPGRSREGGDLGVGDGRRAGHVGQRIRGGDRGDVDPGPVRFAVEYRDTGQKAGQGREVPIGRGSPQRDPAAVEALTLGVVVQVPKSGPDVENLRGVPCLAAEPVLSAATATPRASRSPILAGTRLRSPRRNAPPGSQATTGCGPGVAGVTRSSIRWRPGRRTTATSLRRELAAIRRRGYARNVEETERGVSALGACVRDGRGRAVAAVVVAAATSRARGRALDRLSRPLLASTSVIAAQLPRG